MLITSLGIIVALAAGSFLSALVSDAFADALSRNVEAAFDHMEYRAALRRARRLEMRPAVVETTYAATLRPAA